MICGTIRGVDREISRLVIGGMLFSPFEQEAGFSMLDAFFSAGGNAIDTAHTYLYGDSERLIGLWMKKRRNRQTVFLIDKVGHPSKAVPRPALVQKRCPTTFEKA